MGKRCIQRYIFLGLEIFFLSKIIISESKKNAKGANNHTATVKNCINSKLTAPGSRIAQSTPTAPTTLSTCLHTGNYYTLLSVLFRLLNFTDQQLFWTDIGSKMFIFPNKDPNTSKQTSTHTHPHTFKTT